MHFTTNPKRFQRFNGMRINYKTHIDYPETHIERASTIAIIWNGIQWFRDAVFCARFQDQSCACAYLSCLMLSWWFVIFNWRSPRRSNWFLSALLLDITITCYLTILRKKWSCLQKIQEKLSQNVQCQFVEKNHFNNLFLCFIFLGFFRCVFKLNVAK